MVSKFYMAITAIITPRLSNENVLRQFDKHTRFCLIADHYNTSPTGWPEQKRLIKEDVCFVEQLIKQYPSVTFLTNAWRDDYHNISNVMYWSSCLLWHNHLLKQSNFIPKKNNTLYSCNIQGGKTRINRILAGHWLAKNFPLHELKYNWTENNTLEPIKDIIMSSKYYVKNHIKNKICLSDTFQPDKKIGNSNHHRFITHLLPKYFNPSILSLMVETAGVELTNCVGEKTLYSFAGRCLQFFTGSYQIDSILKQMGFEIFDNIFDYNHLHSNDRYALTIMGFENNKHILLDKSQLLDYFWSHQNEIDHNFALACKSDKFKNFFKEQIEIFKECYAHRDTTIEIANSFTPNLYNIIT